MANWNRDLDGDRNGIKNQWIGHQIVLVLMVLFTTSQGLAQRFEMGSSWPVKEKNMAELLQQRASRLNTQEIQEHWRARVRQYYERPPGLALPRTTHARSHEYVPQAYAYQDIKDIEGRIITPAGTSINVLRTLPFYRPQLYFFNADDARQISYAQGITVSTNTQFILVAGNVIEAQKALQHPVYFDQAGKLTGTFGIKQVPAHVYRQGDVLVIDELNITEDKDSKEDKKDKENDADKAEQEHGA